MTATLTRCDRQLWAREGVLCPFEVLTADEVADYRARVVGVLTAGGQGRMDRLHLSLNWAARLVMHPAIVDRVAELLGDDLLVYGTLALCKQPHDGGYVSWHQDSAYSGLDQTPSLSAWVALTDSNPSNGCLRVIPGSHRQGAIAHGHRHDSRNLLRRGEALDEVDESQARDLILSAGQMSLHASTIIHGSSANLSEGPRIGFIIRYVTSRIPDPGWPLQRVRGDGDCRHLQCREPAL